MPRLFRPHIPVEVRCRVVLRQLGEMFIDNVIDWHRARPDASYMASIGMGHHTRSLGRLLTEKLATLAELLNCKVEDLRLDHDPPLGARERRGEREKTRYTPPANSIDHLAYRPHGPEFAGSHLVKTNIRGDHGQHPDRVLIKRERWRAKRISGNKKGIKSRQKGRSRPLHSASRWPKGRKVNWRRTK